MEGERMKAVRVLAPAKINLLLDITGRLPDGYHTVEMIMQTVTLFDTLWLQPLQGGGITAVCSDPYLPRDLENLAGKAAAAFFAAVGIAGWGVDIQIEKRIPAQAGLGGGSSDAAAVLRALNNMFSAGLSPEQLRQIGVSVGMDVAFCLAGGTLRAQGRGEILTALPALPDCYLLIAKPAHGRSTAQAYSRYDAHPERILHPNRAAMERALAQGDLPEIGRQLANVFEQLLPDSGRDTLLQEFRQAGALGEVMSGSGSAVLGLFAEERLAQRCMQKMHTRPEQFFLVRPLGALPELETAER
jgi:4-diphosphocytidyl-2C-methyl-D-erythritol kinase